MDNPLGNLLASIYQDLSVGTTDMHQHLEQLEHICAEIATDVLSITQFLKDGNEKAALLRALHTLLTIFNHDLHEILAFWDDLRVRVRLQSPMRWGRGESIQRLDGESDAAGRSWWFDSAKAPASARLFAVVGFLITPVRERQRFLGGHVGAGWEGYAVLGKAHYEAWRKDLISRCAGGGG
jgi:hypothetical protein